MGGELVNRAGGRVFFVVGVVWNGEGDDTDFTCHSSSTALLEDIGHLEEDRAPQAESPNPSSSAPSPGDPSPFQAPVYEADELPLPQDLELRESSVAPCSLGVWACRHLNAGEHFGPYVSQQRPRQSEPEQGWEVGMKSLLLTVW
ncbi:MDS1 and EVI1 complex locus protein MDS1-like [Arapaima gigas]